MQAGIIKNSVVLEQMQQSKKAEADAVFAQTEFRRKAPGGPSSAIHCSPFLLLHGVLS